MNYPKVSIITPSYNQAEFLPHTIESVVSQDYPDLEYLIIDGGSTDSSLRIIKKYAAEFPNIIWISEKDKGQSNAINKGFKMASGEITAWLNSDDTYMAGAVRTQADFLTENPHVDLVYGDGAFIDEYGRFKEKFSFAEEFSLEKLINNKIMIMQPAAFWRKKLFDKIGYLNESFEYTMDWDFWIRAGYAGILKYNPVHVANTREYSFTKTFSGGMKRLKEIRYIIRKYSQKKYPPVFFSLASDIAYKKIFLFSPFIALKLKKIIKGGR